jgi:hypothetical protein
VYCAVKANAHKGSLSILGFLHDVMLSKKETLRHFSLIVDTRAQTRSEWNFEYEYRFTEYENDFQSSMVAIGKKCPFFKTKNAVPHAAERRSVL